MVTLTLCMGKGGRHKKGTSETRYAFVPVSLCPLLLPIICIQSPVLGTLLPLPPFGPLTTLY